MSERHFVLAAGGTGGHMMPAHALAEELTRRGHRVALITDERGARIPGLFDGVQTHILPAGRITKNPMTWLAGAKAIMAGRTMEADVPAGATMRTIFSAPGTSPFIARMKARARQAA